MPEFDTVFRLEDLDGTNGYRFIGEEPGHFFGEWVASAGDFNGDGFEDIVVSSHELDAGQDQRGAVYVFFGGAAGLAALDLADGSADGQILAASLDGYNGFRLTGPNDDDRIGHGVNHAGDIDGDGFDDIIFGSEDGISGGAFIQFGRAGPFAATAPPEYSSGVLGYFFDPAGPNGDDRLGYSVSSAGDFNGDGFDDFLIGAIDADPRSGINDEDEGAAYLILGGRDNLEDLDDDDGNLGGVINLEHLSAGQGAVLTNLYDSNDTGNSVAALGDINGDGYDDIAVGSRFFDPDPGAINAGRVHVIFGRPDSAPLPVEILAGSETGLRGFSVEGLGLLL